MSSFFTLIPGADFPPLSREIEALFGGDAYTTKQQVMDFIERFVDIIEQPNSVSPEMRTYLMTEGGSWSMEGSPLNARHLLYWTDRVLKENKVGIGYTDRLSEAGAEWGDAAPDNLTDADPLGLVTTLESLGCKVAVIDPAAVDDGDASSLNGPVLITASSNNCTRLDGATAKSAGGQQGLFVTTPRSDYRYKLWGVKTGQSTGNTAEGGWNMLHEAGGGSIVRFTDGAAPCIILNRYTEGHELAKEIIWRKPASFTAPAYILVSGYPGEFPVIRMGSSFTDGDLDTTNQGPQIEVGFSGLTRDRTHLRNLDFRGNRDGTYLTGENEVAGRVFASTMFLVSGSVDCSMRFCSGTEFLSIESTHSEAASYPEYVDIASEARPASTGNDRGETFVLVRGANFTFDSNYARSAEIDYPGDEYDGSPGNGGEFAATISVEHTNVAVSRNTIIGPSNSECISVRPRTQTPNLSGIVIRQNYVESNGYKCLTFQSAVGQSLVGTIEGNWFINAGTDGQRQTGGTLATVAAQVGTVIRNNLFANNLYGQDQWDGVNTSGLLLYTTADDVLTPNGVGGDVYNNIFYRACLEFGGENAADLDTPTGSRWNVRNLLMHQTSIPQTQEVSESTRFDYLVGVRAGPSEGLGLNTVQACNLTRNPADTNAAVILRYEYDQSPVSSNVYDYNGSFPGFSGHTNVVPTFTDPSTGDMHVSSGPWDSWITSVPKTREEVGAWTPA